jgi:hypothetical protein
VSEIWESQRNELIEMLRIGIQAVKISLFIILGLTLAPRPLFASMLQE